MERLIGFFEGEQSLEEGHNYLLIELPFPDEVKHIVVIDFTDEPEPPTFQTEFTKWVRKEGNLERLHILQKELHAFHTPNKGL